MFSKCLHNLIAGVILVPAALAAAQSTLQFLPGTVATVTGTGTAGAGAGQVSTPRGVALDASGNLYVADTGNNRILKITPAGVITTYAGNRSGSYSGDGGPAISAALHGPEDIALDAAGNLYIADSTNNRIRKVTPGGTISTVAGSSLTVGYGGDGGAATSALLNTPWGVAFDPAGNLYIADSLNNCIRVVNATTQVITTFAGVCTTATGSYGGDGGPATSANLKATRGVAVDAAGTVYIADTNNNRIRVVKGGIITTIWGTGGSTFNGDGLAGTSSTISGPSGVAVDAAGTVYATDVNNFRIRRLVGGITSTLLGTGTSGYNGDGIPANTAQIASAVKVAVDPAGNLYTADSLSRVREVLAAQATLAFGNQGVGTTSAAKALTLFNTGANAVTIASVVASSGYTAQGGTGNCAAGVVVASGASCTVSVTFSPTALGASTGTVTVTDNGATQVISLTGTGTLAPSTVALTLAPGSVDLGGNTVVSVSVTAPAGVGSIPTGTVTFTANGTSIGSSVTLAPNGTATESFGSTLAPGNYSIVANYSGDSNFLPGANSPAATLAVTGLATSTSFTVTPASPQAGQSVTFLATVAHSAGSSSPSGTASFYDGTLLNTVAVDTNGQASYVAMLPYGTHQLSVAYSGDALYNPSSAPSQLVMVGPGPVASITPAIVNTIAGGLTTGYGGDGGPATSAILAAPYDVAVDIANNIYIADCTNNRVRRISGGIITTFAGTGSGAYGGDGGLATKAQLKCPRALAADGYGNLYISDYGNSVIRMVNTSGVINTIAGKAGTPGYSGDGGQALNATFTNPWGLAVDPSGNLYIADAGNYVVRKVDASGTITTIAGRNSAGAAGGTTGDGGPASQATFQNPNRLALDAAGNLYVSDFSANRVRRIATDGSISTYVGNGTAAFAGDGGPATDASLNGPWGIATDAAGDLYIADKTSGAIRMVNAAGIITTIAGTGITDYTGNGGPATRAQFLAPWGVALDSIGNVYIADTTSRDTESAVRELTVGSGAINFGTLTVGGDQPVPILGTLTNTGAQNLALSSIAVAGAGFSLQSGTPNGCSASTMLAPSASCAFSVGFTYSVLGNSTGTLVLTDNSGNVANATQTVALTAVTALPTVTVELSISPVIFASPGTSVTFTATVTPGAIQPGAPTGTVTFLANGSPLGSGTIQNGVATFSTSSLVLGTYTITASYGGDVNYQPAVSAGQTYTISYDFQFTVTPPTADVALGSEIDGTVTLTPAVGFTTPAVLSCSNLPYGYSCVFGSATLTSDGSGTPLTTTLELKYTAPRAELPPGRNLFYAGLLFILLGVPAVRRRKLRGLLAAVFLAAVSFAAGCGGGTGPTSSVNHASYPVNVTATAGVVVHGAVVTLHLQ